MWTSIFWWNRVRYCIQWKTSPPSFPGFRPIRRTQSASDFSPSQAPKLYIQYIYSKNIYSIFIYDTNHPHTTGGGNPLLPPPMGGGGGGDRPTLHHIYIYIYIYISIYTDIYIYIHSVYGAVLARPHYHQRGGVALMLPPLPPVACGMGMGGSLVPFPPRRGLWYGDGWSVLQCIWWTRTPGPLVFADQLQPNLLWDVDFNTCPTGVAGLASPWNVSVGPFLGHSQCGCLRLLAAVEAIPRRSEASNTRRAGIKIKIL